MCINNSDSRLIISNSSFDLDWADHIIEVPGAESVYVSVNSQRLATEVTILVDSNASSTASEQLDGADNVIKVVAVESVDRVGSGDKVSSIKTVLVESDLAFAFMSESEGLDVVVQAVFRQVRNTGSELLADLSLTFICSAHFSVATFSELEWRDVIEANGINISGGSVGTERNWVSLIIIFVVEGDDTSLVREGDKFISLSWDAWLDSESSSRAKGNQKHSNENEKLSHCNCCCSCSCWVEAVFYCLL